MFHNVSMFFQFSPEQVLCAGKTDVANWTSLDWNTGAWDLLESRNYFTIISFKFWIFLCWILSSPEAVKHCKTKTHHITSRASDHWATFPTDTTPLWWDFRGFGGLLGEWRWTGMMPGPWSGASWGVWASWLNQRNAYAVFQLWWWPWARTLQVHDQNVARKGRTVF